VTTLTVPTWTADGYWNWTADGYPGWTADGFEPRDYAAAQAILAAEGVSFGEPVTYAYSPLNAPVGFVIGYNPSAGQAVPAGTTAPTISLGPVPVPPTLTVPNVVGKYFYDAQLALLQAGFLIGQPTYQPSASIIPGIVISQSVSAGSTFTTQWQVLIVVSDGPPGISITP